MSTAGVDVYASESNYTLLTAFNTYTSSTATQIANVYASESNYVQLSLFGPYTSSTNTQILNVYASESNYTLTSSFNTLSSSLAAQTGNIFSSESNYLPTSSFQTFSASVSSQLTGSVFNSGSLLLTSSFNTYTSSTATQILNVYASESNYNSTASFNTFSSSFVTTSASLLSLINAVSGSQLIISGTYTGSNGITLSGSYFLLGQNVTQSGSPAALQSNREIPLNSHNILFTGNGNIGINNSTPLSPLDIIGNVNASSITIVGYKTIGDGTHASISTYAAPTAVWSQSYAQGVTEHAFCAPNANGWYGYTGVQSWAYLYPGAGITYQPGNAASRFLNYMCAFSANQTYDNSGSRLFAEFGYFVSLNVQNGIVSGGYDFYACEINSTGLTMNLPTMSAHYGLYMEQFSKAERIGEYTSADHNKIISPVQWE